MRHIQDNLYIGDIYDAQGMGYEFDEVISLTEDEINTTTTHIPLTDDEHNSPKEFNYAVEIVIDAVRSSGDVLVHCNAGISRSVAVCAAAHSVANDVEWGQAYTDCKCGFNDSHRSLRTMSREYAELYR